MFVGHASMREILASADNVLTQKMAARMVGALISTANSLLPICGCPVACFWKRNACEPPYNGLMAQLNINTLVSPKTQILNFNLH